MFVATVIVSIALAVLLLMSATGRLRHDPATRTWQRVRSPKDKV